MILDKDDLPIVLGREEATEDETATEHWELVEAVKLLVEEVRALKGRA